MPNRRLLLLIVCGLSLNVLNTPAFAQEKAASPATSATTASVLPGFSTGPGWKDLTPKQQQVLAPLAPTWTEMPDLRRRKWVELANRYDKLSTVEQERMQARMREWASLTTEQRRMARENYKTVDQLSKDERQARWEAYQQLSEEERKALAEQARKARQGMTDPSRPIGAAAYTRPSSKNVQPITGER